MKNGCCWIAISASIVLAGCGADAVSDSGGYKLTWADSSPQTMSRAAFDELFDSVSNWGRWGPDDQLGTLNLITPAKRREAAALVVDGFSVSMALDLNKQADDINELPVEHEVFTGEFAGHKWAGDSFSINYHGYAHSHVDGLQHVAHKGILYNGLPIDTLVPEGVESLGVQNMGVAGIFSRGVLIDLPRFLGRDFVSAGQAISVADLEAWEKASGVTVSSGDVLLLRTGRWRQVEDEGQWPLTTKSTGLHVSVAEWLRKRDVAVLGCDGISDVAPASVEGLALPLHEVVLAGLGMPLLDNLDLEAVAAAAAERDRSTFLFVGLPLRMPGGTGSPLNPIAVF